MKTNEELEDGLQRLFALYKEIELRVNNLEIARESIKE